MTAQLATQIQDALGSGYRVERELAGGGMSRLFLATDLRHGRRVVVKVLSPELVSTTSTARFKREIELTVRLQHPHILPILTSGAWEDWLYYITPFIPGESLRERIARDGKLPLDDVVKILRDASGALAFAHSRGVVHRDVKPGNILLADGHAILADFGIARAVSSQETPLTGSGMTPGTPAYMAPELPTDQSADVYALGVVAYEMLCGVLPKRGVTARDVMAARGSVAGDSRSRLQPTASLIASAVSGSPETRTATAQAFLEQLDVRPARSAPRIAIAGMALVAAAVVALVFARARGAALRPDAYAVLSLGGTDSIKSDMVQRIGDALGEWDGVKLADSGELANALRPYGTGPLQRKEAEAAARSVGARNVVSVDARRVGDSIVVRTGLYDASGDSMVKDSRIVYSQSADAATRTMALRGLVNALVRSGAELPWRSVGDSARPSLAAWRAYDAGRGAVRRWDLHAAEQDFRDAVAADPRHGLAHLWLAQALSWARRDASNDDLRPSLHHALDARTLSSRDSIRAAALLAMADANVVAARDEFRHLISLDSTDFASWLDLGDCESSDQLVVRNLKSPTGWSFRSSFEGAMRAYQRSADLAPAGTESAFREWLLGRLSVVLYSVTNRARLGYALDADTVRFASLAFLDADTLAFWPYAIRDFFAGTHNPPPSSVQAATARNRNIMRRAVEEWVQRAPQSAAAYDSLAAWTEVSGGIARISERNVPTLDVVRRARALSRDATQQLRLAVAEVRLLLKDSRFPEARAEADSLFRTGASARNGAVVGIPGLAVLLGHVEQAAQLLPAAGLDTRVHTADGRIVALTPQVQATAARLAVYAAMGVPGDSVVVIARRTMGLIASYVPDAALASQVTGTIVGPAMTLVYPDGADVLRSFAGQPDLTSQAYVLLANGDTAGARQKLTALRHLAEGSVQGTAIDGNFRRARLALILGDTASALQDLDPILRALPTLAPSLFFQIGQVAALVRALALRAEVASARRDATTAKQCAGAVMVLWRDADASLQPLVKRMSGLSH